MSRVLKQFIEPPRPCSYLEAETATLEHKLMVDVSAEELDHLFEHGYRRFGPDYFRPACGSCSQCIPTRIPVASFAPTKSQRRARRNIDDLRIMIGPPRIDEERLELYQRWHRDREAEREWAPSALDARSYGFQFAYPHPSAREVTFHDDARGGAIVGVSICDETPQAWSLAYFFYDPAYASRSLGVANVVLGVDIARSRKLPFVYLGFAVEACASLRYKRRYGPREELIGWPEPSETPRWERAV